MYLLLAALLYTTVLGFITYKKRVGVLQLLPWFQLTMFIAEVMAFSMSFQGKENMVIYDWVTVIEFVFFASLYIVYSRTKTNKILSILLLVFFLISVKLFVLKINWIVVLPYNLVSFYLSSLFLIILAIAYLVELLRSDDILFFNKNPMFWISIGLMLYMGSSSFLIVSNYLRIHFQYQSLIHTSVTSVSALSLYTCISIAMLCKKYGK